MLQMLLTKQIFIWIPHYILHDKLDGKFISNRKQIRIQTITPCLESHKVLFYVSFYLNIIECLKFIWNLSYADNLDMFLNIELPQVTGALNYKIILIILINAMWLLIIKSNKLSATPVLLTTTLLPAQNWLQILEWNLVTNFHFYLMQNLVSVTYKNLEFIFYKLQHSCIVLLVRSKLLHNI